MALFLIWIGGRGWAFGSCLDRRRTAGGAFYATPLKHLGPPLSYSGHAFSFRIRYQSSPFPETDQWRQARARAWASGS
jgi:hypothetical protein